jgi:hypothetical protein
MHIAFDNSNRLRRNAYCFEYSGVSFKLVQNGRTKYADVLLTLVPIRDDAAEQRAYSAAAEFLSALSWQNASRVALQACGGVGVRDGFLLRDAKCRIFTFRQVAFGGLAGGYAISTLPKVETDDQRTALALYREARSSNKTWLAFLLFWQVLEVGGRIQPRAWIDKQVRAYPRKIHVPADNIRGLGLGTRKLGDYLENDCRHAIAHIRRTPGERALLVDVRADNVRMAISARVIECFAAHYIREVLGLSSRVHLVRGAAGRFPAFRTEEP